MSMARRCARHSRIRRRRRGSRPSALPDAAQRFLEAVEALNGAIGEGKLAVAVSGGPDSLALLLLAHAAFPGRGSEEHTSELQSLMRISYAVFCLQKKQLSSTPITITQALYFC